MRIEDEINQHSFANEYQKLLINIIYTSNWLSGVISQAMRQYNITPQQYNVLRILRGQYPASCSITTVRERMLDKMSDASRIIERLRKKGLLERKTGELDRRKADVCITREGLKLLSKIDKVTLSFYDRMKGVSTQEALLMNDLLDKLRS